MLDAYIERCASGNAHGHLSGLGVMALACGAGNAANEWLVLSSSYWPHAANFGQSWPAFASNGFSFLSPSAARCVWHTIRWLVPPMGMGSEREVPRPLVLRHAYQSETRRY